MAKDGKTPAAVQEQEQPMDRQALENEKKKLKSDKKQQKKEAKRRARELAEQESSLGDEESGGALTFLVTLAIVAVWLGIICVVIKLDVGGFGSGVMAPLLKNIPVVNKILPEEKQPVPGEEDGPDNPEGYTLEEALARISQLEAQLEQAQGGSLGKDEEIASLKAENARLQEFEDAQVEFQRIKTEFFEDVIYAENGPGPEAFRKYFEEMDPTTAEYLYKQVVKQLEESEAFQEYASSFVEMKPKSAAATLEKMTDDMDLVARILNALTPQERGEILQNMTPEVAAKLMKTMNPDS